MIYQFSTWMSCYNLKKIPVVYIQIQSSQLLLAWGRGSSVYQGSIWHNSGKALSVYTFKEGVVFIKHLVIRAGIQLVRHNTIKMIKRTVQTNFNMAAPQPPNMLDFANKHVNKHQTC